MRNMDSVINCSIDPLRGESFCKLAIPLGIASLVNNFVQTPFEKMLTIGGAIGGWVCQDMWLGKKISHIFTGSSDLPYDSWSESDKNLWNSFLFWWSSGQNGQTLIHEMGHAVAAKVVYRHAVPTVTIGRIPIFWVEKKFTTETRRTKR